MEATPASPVPGLVPAKCPSKMSPIWMAACRCDIGLVSNSQEKLVAFSLWRPRAFEPQKQSAGAGRKSAWVISALGLVANAGRGPEFLVQTWDSSLPVLLPSVHLSPLPYLREHLSWAYLGGCQESRLKPTEEQKDSAAQSLSVPLDLPNGRCSTASAAPTCLQKDPQGLLRSSRHHNVLPLS